MTTQPSQHMEMGLTLHKKNGKIVNKYDGTPMTTNDIYKFVDEFFNNDIQNEFHTFLYNNNPEEIFKFKFNGNNAYIQKNSYFLNKNKLLTSKRIKKKSKKKK